MKELKNELLLMHSACRRLMKACHTITFTLLVIAAVVYILLILFQLQLWIGIITAPVTLIICVVTYSIMVARANRIARSHYSKIEKLAFQHLDKIDQSVAEYCDRNDLHLNTHWYLMGIYLTISFSPSYGHGADGSISSLDLSIDDRFQNGVKQCTIRVGYVIKRDENCVCEIEYKTYIFGNSQYFVFIELLHYRCESFFLFIYWDIERNNWPTKNS